MRMHSPKEVVLELQRGRLFESDHGGTLWIQRSKDVIDGSVLASGIESLQYNQQGVLPLGIHHAL
jgi:hypothetical protein